MLECSDLGGLMAAFQSIHYSVRSLTPELKAHTAEQFIQGLDPSRTLLLDAEVEKLKGELVESFGDIQNGDCAEIEKAYALIQSRAAADTKQVKKLLAGRFKVDRSVELIVDPEERGYPKTPKERAKLGRALVHFQMANYLKGGITKKKAKEQLIHRYELAEKRLEEQVAEKRLPQLLAEAFARSLDPHSQLMSYDSHEDFQIRMQLSLEGIGAALRTEDGFTHIESLIAGGGAAKSGRLRPKDKIISVAQEGEDPVSTIDMSIRDVVKLIRGPKGTKVTLTILRDGAKTKTFDVTIVRDKIDVAQQAAKLEIEERKIGEKVTKVGVLELPSFYGSGRSNEGRSSYEDVKRLLKEADEAGAESLVLDLSKNGGGYLEDAVRISGLFIEKGAVVATQDTAGNESVLEDEDSSTEWSKPMVVLISPMSASASEILAGALKTYRRAVIVGAGEATFGKGSVQSVRELPRRLGAMKITTGMFFLPSGRSTQQHGVEADVVVPSLLSTIDMGEKDLDYSLPPGSIDAFLSDNVNGDGKDHWTPVTSIAVASLAGRSRARVSEKALFREVEEAIEEAKGKKSKITVGELLEDAKKDEAKENTEEEDEDQNRYERMEEAFVDEAVDVAVDLAGLVAGRPELSARDQLEKSKTIQR